MTKQTPLTTITLTVIAIITRFLPHPPNFTAVGATSTFGGATLPRPFSYLVPLVALFISDLFLGFHATMPYVYACFVFGVLLGEKALRNNPSQLKIGSVAIINSTVFFIVTNLGVWAGSGMYEQSLSGLFTCFVLALPFGLSMLGADLVYTLGFFQLHQYATKSQYVVQLDERLKKALN